MSECIFAGNLIAMNVSGAHGMGGVNLMRENIQQLNHLAEVLYNESRNLDTISKGKAQLYQDIIDEIQENIDSIMNEIYDYEKHK